MILVPSGRGVAMVDNGCNKVSLSSKGLAKWKVRHGEWEYLDLSRSQHKGRTMEEVLLIR